MNKIMTYKKFLEKVNKLKQDQKNKPENTRLRYGQIIMNELWQTWPKKYDYITNSDMDPFYDDNKVKDVLCYLESNWPATSMNKTNNTIEITTPFSLKQLLREAEDFCYSNSIEYDERKINITTDYGTKIILIYKD